MSGAAKRRAMTRLYRANAFFQAGGDKNELKKHMDMFSASVVALSTDNKSPDAVYQAISLFFENVVYKNRGGTLSLALNALSFIVENTTDVNLLSYILVFTSKVSSECLGSNEVLLSLVRLTKSMSIRMTPQSLATLPQVRTLIRKVTDFHSHRNPLVRMGIKSSVLSLVQSVGLDAVLSENPYLLRILEHIWTRYESLPDLERGTHRLAAAFLADAYDDLSFFGDVLRALSSYDCLKQRSETCALITDALAVPAANLVKASLASGDLKGIYVGLVMSAQIVHLVPALSVVNPLIASLFRGTCVRKVIHRVLLLYELSDNPEDFELALPALCLFVYTLERALGSQRMSNAIGMTAGLMSFRKEEAGSRSVVEILGLSRVSKDPLIQSNLDILSLRSDFDPSKVAYTDVDVVSILAAPQQPKYWAAVLALSVINMASVPTTSEGLGMLEALGGAGEVGGGGVEVPIDKLLGSPAELEMEPHGSSNRGDVRSLISNAIETVYQR